MLDGGLLFLLLLCFLGRDEGAASSPTGPPTPEQKKASTTPAPWPQVVPTGLPHFPGAGWVPDEPPPAAVSTRAYQLLNQLWAGGSGTFKTEKVGERWITFRAEVVKSGKKGVVAYRLKDANAPQTYPPQPLPDSRTPAPASPSGTESPPWGVPAEYRTPPALPQASSPGASPTYASTAPGAASSPSNVRTLSLKSPMMSGADVALAQQHLHISADGKFGPATKAAVVAFQKAHGLAADGIVGPLTWKPLLLA